MFKLILRIFIPSIIILCDYDASRGQNLATIAGVIVDSETNEVIPYASVSILDQDQLVTGSISLEDGAFIVDGISPGEYDLSISFIGYENFVDQLLIGELNQNYDLGTIALQPSGIQLDEVVVSEQRSELSSGLDKKSFDLTNQISQSGGSVMDAMKALPSVSFDQEGKVILRGSDRVIVLIDGKQSSLTGFGNQKGLDNIPAANIERIEIINNPSAKYDANGMAGIINIIYKKENQTGWNGSIGFDYGLGALAKRRADLPTQLGSYSPTPKYIPSINLNYKEDRFGFFVQSEILFQERLPNNEFTIRQYDDGRIIASQVPENRTQDHYIIKGGLDYYLDDHNILSLSGIYDWEKHTDTAQVAYINQNENVRNRYITWNEEEITGYVNLALNYEHQFRQPGHELTTGLQYSRGWEDETYFLNDSSMIRSDGRDITSVLGTEHITSFTADYIKPSKSGRLELGTKLQIRNLPVDYEQVRDENSMLYPGLGTFSKWGERLFAGYANWVTEKPGYDIEGGLRAEYTSVFYNMDPANIYYQDNDSYDYFRLFPNIRLTAKLNDHHRLSLFYNQRIDRPGEPELRMYSKSDDHELVKVGNPYLRPQFTHTAEIAYKYFWNTGSVFLSGYYRLIKDSFQRVYSRDTTSVFDVVIKTFANTGRSKHLGSEVVWSQEISDFWKLSGNLNLYRISIDRHTGQLLFPYPQSFVIQEDSGSTWDAKLSSTFTFRQGLQAQVTGIYFADRVVPQGKQLARSSVDIGINQKLWAGKGEFTLAISDIFNRFGIRQEIDGDGFTAEYQNFYETQSIRTGLKMKF